MAKESFKIYLINISTSHHESTNNYLVNYKNSLTYCDTTSKKSFLY